MTIYPVEFHRCLEQKWASGIDQILTAIGNTAPPRAPAVEPRAEARILRIGTARLVTGLAAVLGLALMFASLPAAAQQWTPKQRAACDPDAMRLCNQYVPDVRRVSDCMSHYRRYLSPACRAVFYGGQRKKLRRR